MSVKHFL
jgi:hypothetical protein